MKVTPKFRRFAKKDYRRYVGPAWAYDLKSAYQFMVCTALGLRADQDFLEIGCGSLRAGRLFIAYLDPGRYCGLESTKSVTELAINAELGNEYYAIKRPFLTYNDQFDLQIMGRNFDMILAHAVMIHLGRGSLRLMFRAVKKYLKPDGIFLGNYHVGKDFKELEAIYPQITRYTQQTMRKLVKGAGLHFEPLALNDFRPNTRWFVATHPDNPPALGPDSVAGMLNNFWEGYGK